jgi:uncharacterized OB-fold protein
MPKVIPPVLGHDDQFFFDGAKQGKLLIRRCANCERLQHPPTPMCPHCASLEWGVQELTGRGIVHGWVCSYHPTELDEAPRIVAVVELDEGVRLVSNLQGVDVADVTNGMTVHVTFEELETVDGGTVVLPQFRPDEGVRKTENEVAGS